MAGHKRDIDPDDIMILQLLSAQRLKDIKAVASRVGTRNDRLSDKDLYHHDPFFHHLVDGMAKMLHDRSVTESMLRRAVHLAITIVAEEQR